MTLPANNTHCLLPHFVTNCVLYSFLHYCEDWRERQEEVSIFYLRFSIYYRPAGLAHLYSYFLRQGSSADYVGIFAEGGETNLDRLFLQVPNLLVKEIFYPVQQDVTCGNHSACKDDAFWFCGVEDVDAENSNRFGGFIGGHFG